MNNNNIECEEIGRCPEKLCIVTDGGHEHAKEDWITNNNKETQDTSFDEKDESSKEQSLNFDPVGKKSKKYSWNLQCAIYWESSFGVPTLTEWYNIIFAF